MFILVARFRFSCVGWGRHTVCNLLSWSLQGLGLLKCQIFGELSTKVAHGVLAALPPQAVLSSGTPLAQVLVDEGLSHQLQDIVLYGIAMCSTSQALGQQHTASSSQAGLMTAAQGAATLQLFTESLGRFGAAGAFMVPTYGSGSLPEAFVRFAAVHGAVTVLRHQLSHLVMGPGGAQQEEQVVEQGGSGGQRRVTGVVTQSGQVLRVKEKLVVSSRVARWEEGGGEWQHLVVTCWSWPARSLLVCCSGYCCIAAL